jgi:soluble lytic murein transglycosylase
MVQRRLFSPCLPHIFYLLLLSVALLITFLTTISLASDDVSNYLLNGKNSLDKGDYENAISQLTTAYEKLPVLGDYALLWRARAYEDRGDIDRAIADLRTIKERYKDSPLIKTVRIKEIELFQKKSEVRRQKSEVRKILEEFVRDYPSELNIKYAYASLLKENGETEKAKKIFKEIYISVSPLSKSALNELSPSDITTEDLIKRGENLNKAWMFGEAEKCLREALHRIQNTEARSQTTELKTQILEKLAYSIFRQKRYREAAELYKELNNRYWRARSVFRAGDMEAFESELQELIKTGDKRVASVLIAYGSKQRRDGNIEKALEIFNNTLSKYPSEKEETLWAKGWTYYLSGDYKNASEMFSQLHQIYGGSKYLYWKNKCAEKTDHNALSVESQASSAQPKTHNVLRTTHNAQRTTSGIPHRDYYGFLSLLKNSKEIIEVTSNEKSKDIKSSVSDSSLITRHSSPFFERVDILIRLGLNNEAVSELTYLTKKNPDHDRLIYISSQLKNLGNYKMSVNLVTKIQYSEDLHDLFYPIAFQQEVEDASRKIGIDSLLIQSVMREESRFDTDARSIAGALGLMQLMPSTAHRYDKHVKITLKNANQLYDAKTNILIGSYYLKHLIKTFNSIPLAIAAYNAGEEAVREWLKKGNYTTIDEFIEDIPYDETRNYVKRVLTTYFEYMRAGRDIYAAKKYIGNL